MVLLAGEGTKTIDNRVHCRLRCVAARVGQKQMPTGEQPHRETARYMLLPRRKVSRHYRLVIATP